MRGRHKRTVLLVGVSAAWFLGVVMGRAEPALAAFPDPGNGKIVFTSLRDGPRGEIYVMNPDGTAQTNVTNFGSAHDDRADWSASGTQIAFTSNRTGVGDIYVMNADGSNLHFLAGSDTSSDFYPAWSPTGASIAFSSTRAASVDIFVVNADGTGETNLTLNSTFDAGPSWSPSGAQIAYTTERAGLGTEVAIMNPDGTGQVNLSNNAASDVDPDWSPDGTRIAFTSNRDGNDEIYVMRADGSEQVRITNSQLFDGHPAWSPDGTRIAFTRQIGTNLDIWVMNADGTNQVRLTTANGNDLDPDWARDLEPPPPPVPTATTPASPANDNHPRVLGTAEAGSTVRLFRNATCTTGVAGVGSAAAFASPGLEIDVADDSTTTVWATATDPSGNVSGCSTASVVYVEDSTAPETTIDSGPTGSTTDDTPEFTFSASEAGATFECRIDDALFAACASPYTSDPLPAGSHTFAVRATDSVANTDPSPATRSFTIAAAPAPARCLLRIPLPAGLGTLCVPRLI